MKRTVPDESPSPLAGFAPVWVLRLAPPGAGRRRNGQFFLAGQRHCWPASASASHPTPGPDCEPTPLVPGMALLTGYNKAGSLGVVPASEAPASVSFPGTYACPAWHNKLRNYSVEGGVPATINSPASASYSYEFCFSAPALAGNLPNIPADDSTGLGLVA